MYLFKIAKVKCFLFCTAIALGFITRETWVRVHLVFIAKSKEGENTLYTFGFQKRPLYTHISIRNPL